MPVDKNTKAVDDRTEKKSSPKATTKNDSNIFGALSYLWILSVVFYITNKDDTYVVFHAKQGMVLFALSLIVLIPIVVWFLSIPVYLIVLVASLVGAIKAYQGEKYKLPVISDIAEKINF